MHEDTNADGCKLLSFSGSASFTDQQGKLQRQRYSQKTMQNGGID
jgi:hypothetical protein